MTSGGVNFQIAGSESGKTKVRMDGSRLLINEHYYGTVQSGDTVVVSDDGAVSVNGTKRAKQAAP